MFIFWVFHRMWILLFCCMISNNTSYLNPRFYNTILSIYRFCSDNLFTIFLLISKLSNIPVHIQASFSAHFHDIFGRILVEPKNFADVIATIWDRRINIINQGKSPSFPPLENIILIYDRKLLCKELEYNLLICTHCLGENMHRKKIFMWY